MAAPKPQGRDFGAALAGLVLGGSVIFLIMLTIVWLTNTKFEAHKAEKAAHAAPAASASATTSPTPAPAAKH